MRQKMRASRQEVDAEKYEFEKLSPNPPVKTPTPSQIESIGQREVSVEAPVTIAMERGAPL